MNPPDEEVFEDEIARDFPSLVQHWCDYVRQCNKVRILCTYSAFPAGYRGPYKGYKVTPALGLLRVGAALVAYYSLNRPMDASIFARFTISSVCPDDKRSETLELLRLLAVESARITGRSFIRQGETLEQFFGNYDFGGMLQFTRFSRFSAEAEVWWRENYPVCVLPENSSLEHLGRHSIPRDMRSFFERMGCFLDEDFDFLIDGDEDPVEKADMVDRVEFFRELPQIQSIEMHF
jgi:hypothetical protein